MMAKNQLTTWLIVYEDGVQQEVSAKGKAHALIQATHGRKVERCVELPWGPIRPTASVG